MIKHISDNKYEYSCIWTPGSGGRNFFFVYVHEILIRPPYMCVGVGYIEQFEDTFVDAGY